MRAKSQEAVYSLGKEGMKETRLSSSMPFYAKKSDVRKGLRGEGNIIPYYILDDHSRAALKAALEFNGQPALVKKNLDGSLEIGCQFFQKDQARKLKAWANSK